MKARGAQRGYILVLVMIAIAVVLVGSVAIGVIYGRSLNQQREVETKAKLVTAFHALFPGNERKQANMYSDFGYTPVSPGAPPTNHWDLSGLVVRANVATTNGGTTPSAFAGSFTLGASSPGAWNGPYWSDAVDASNRPIDAWGRPLQLRYISTSTPPGWQVFSLGANGASNTGDTQTPGGDDLVYPIPPYVIPAAAATTCPSPSVVVNRTSGFNPAETLTITVTYSGGSQTLSTTITHGGGDTATFTFTNLPVGTISYTMTSSKSGNPFFRGPWSGSFTLSSGCSASPISI